MTNARRETLRLLAEADAALDSASRIRAAFGDTEPPPASPATIPSPAPLECLTLDALPADGTEECWLCDGTGQRWNSLATYSDPASSYPCPVCEGTGRL